MEDGSNYSLHEHPLIHNDDQLESWCCNACGLPLLLSPSYRCNNGDCNFFLHKACRQLPKKLNYVGADGIKYSLTLVIKPPNEEWKCDVCRKLMGKINSIAYHGTSNPSIEHQLAQVGINLRLLNWTLLNWEMMSGRRRTIQVHPLCAPFLLEIKSRHDSHEHELVAMRREAQLLCDVCEEEHKGLFFSCKEYLCDFYVHKDCAILPRIIDSAVHDHLLVFSYSAFGAGFSRLIMAHRHCKICAKPFTRTGAYYCLLCQEFVHVNCAISSDKNSGYEMLNKKRIENEEGAAENEDPRIPPVQLPFEEGTEKNLFLHKMLNKKRIENNKEDEKLSIEEYHEHSNLIFHDNIDIDDDHKDYSSSFCNACIQPVATSHPFYSCQEPGCDFLLHKRCADLPSQIDLGLIPSVLKTSPGHIKRVADEFLSLFHCSFCGNLCNGFGYEFDGSWDYPAEEHFRYFPSSPQPIADIGCASLPREIKHRLHHTQHILILTVTLTDRTPCACCTGINVPPQIIVYECVSCNFKVHITCALLPAKVNHKFDKHPLQLSKGYTNHVNDSEHCFCEICEEDINTKFWFYHCERCEQFFHIKCIPSVGLLSKIKFGGTVVIPYHTSDHPMTFTRMLNIGDQRCGKCKGLIRGFKDDMAFQCSKCCYWIHFLCADLPKNQFLSRYRWI